MSNPLILTLIWLAAVGTAVVFVSFAIEAMRPIPATPERLPWAPDIPVRYVTVNGIRLRYITAGEGPALKEHRKCDDPRVAGGPDVLSKSAAPSQAETKHKATEPA